MICHLFDIRDCVYILFFKTGKRRSILVAGGGRVCLCKIDRQTFDIIDRDPNYIQLVLPTLLVIWCMSSLIFTGVLSRSHV